MLHISWSIVADVVIGIVIYKVSYAVLNELFGPNVRALLEFFTWWLQNPRRKK